MTFTLQAHSLMEKAEPVQVRFTRRLGDQQSMWMQDGCKVYVDSYMVSNGSCFMVIWIIFKNHLLGVDLTQNQETMAFRTLTTTDLLYFYHVWRSAWIEIDWNSIWLRVGHIWLHTTPEGPWPHYMILGVCWDSLCALSFGLSHIHGHGSWVVCEVGPSLSSTWSLTKPIWETSLQVTHHRHCEVVITQVSCEAHTYKMFEFLDMTLLVSSYDCSIWLWKNAFGSNEIDDAVLKDFYEAFGLGMSALLHTLRFHLHVWIRCPKLGLFDFCVDSRFSRAF